MKLLVPFKYADYRGDGREQRSSRIGLNWLEEQHSCTFVAILPVTSLKAVDLLMKSIQLRIIILYTEYA